MLLVPSENFDQSSLEADPAIRPYRGIVVGEPESRVRLTFDTVRGSLDGEVFLPGAGLHYVEPTRPGSLNHVWYHTNDAIVRMPHGDAIPTSERSPEGDPFPDVPAPGTYNLMVIRIYFDNENPTSIVNLVDDMYAAEVGIKNYVLSTQSLNTNAYQTPVTCNPGDTDNFLTDFRDATSPPPSNVDKSQLFTHNTNINYQNLLGCGFVGGDWSWVQFVGNTKQKKLVAAHELGHNFGAGDLTDDIVPHQHCFGFCWNHNHFTIMHYQYDDFDNAMNEYFWSTSDQAITTEGNALPRTAQLWSGSDTSQHNVKLTYWYMHYLDNPTASTIFTFKRTWAAASGTVSLNNAFIGARNCGTDTCNFDFGHLGAQTLTTTPTSNQWSWDPPSGGATWRFWPAYQTQGGAYGPQWHQLSVWIS